MDFHSTPNALTKRLDFFRLRIPSVDPCRRENSRGRSVRQALRRLRLDVCGPKGARSERKHGKGSIIKNLLIRQCCQQPPTHLALVFFGKITHTPQLTLEKRPASLTSNKVAIWNFVNNLRDGRQLVRNADQAAHYQSEYLGAYDRCPQAIGPESWL